MRPVGHTNTNLWSTNTHLTVETHTWFYTHATAPGPIGISIVTIKQIDPASVRMCVDNCSRRFHNNETMKQ